MIRVLIKTDTRYPVNRKVVRKAVLDTFSDFKIEDADVEVSVAIVGRRKMKALSAEFLDDLKIHEVLSFAQEEVFGSDSRGFVNPPDSILRLGDIVICWPKLLDLASRDETMVDDQLYFLSKHAAEHLMGKHHQ